MPAGRSPPRRSPPRLVIFDMDDVLVRYDVERRRAAIGALAGLSAAEVGRRIWDGGIEDAGDVGALSADAYLAAVAEALGQPFGRQDWLDTRRVATTVDPAMVALAAAVKAGVPVALLTNNGFLMKQHFDDLVPELRVVFGQAMHAAAEFGTKKPDPGIYRRLAALHGTDPREAMMIDDKPGHVAGAEAAGLLGHHFRDRGTLETHLAAIGLI